MTFQVVASGINRLTNFSLKFHECRLSTEAPNHRPSPTGEQLTDPSVDVTFQWLIAMEKLCTGFATKDNKPLPASLRGSLTLPPVASSRLLMPSPMSDRSSPAPTRNDLSRGRHPSGRRTTCDTTTLLPPNMPPIRLASG